MAWWPDDRLEVRRLGRCDGSLCTARSHPEICHENRDRDPDEDEAAELRWLQLLVEHRQSQEEDDRGREILNEAQRRIYYPARCNRKQQERLLTGRPSVVGL